MFFQSIAFAEEIVEETAVQEPSWFSKVFSKFSEIAPTTWIILAALVLVASVFLAISKTRKAWSARMITYGALSIALSFVLSYIRLFRMPTGGSVTLASMLPIMLFSAAYGIAPGLAAGLLYGMLQYFQGGWFLSPMQFVLDYLLAFTALGLTGLANNNKKDSILYLGICLAAFGRAVCAILAGIMWANASVEPLKIGSVIYTSPLLYSAVYNGAYLIPDTIICVLLALLAAKPILKIMKNP